MQVLGDDEALDIRIDREFAAKLGDTMSLRSLETRCHTVTGSVAIGSRKA